MQPLHWTKKQARDFLVQYHMINSEHQIEGKQAVKIVFDRLKTIQFDPLDVVGRNPDLVLQSRIKNYDKSYLQDLLYTDRYLIDGWDKMMSIYEISDFHHFERIRDYRAKIADGYHRFHEVSHALDHSEEILELIRQKGPMFSRDIDLDSRWKHGKLSSITLDYLFITGQIVVSDKIGAQKKFDLAERIIKEQSIEMTDDEFNLWYMKRRIASMGLVWNKSSVSWSGMNIENKTLRSKYIKHMLKSGELTKVEVDDVSEPFYVLSDSLKDINEIQKKISFIAPLDNMIWDRQLMKTIFDFDYTWEVYVPKSKRKYGYYVLPILYGSDFIGRIEFEHHRQNNPLAIKQIWFEQDIKPTKALQDHLQKALKDFAKYLGAKEVNRVEL